MANEPVTVYLGLGSNMGDRQKNLDTALELLAQRMKLGKISSIYDTEPVGVPPQSRFLNLVCRASTRLEPVALLKLAKGIEARLGRSGKSDAPRPIDIDILLYGEEVINTPELVIPHPRMTERAFVLIPLVEMAPNLVHPLLKKTIRELLKNITEKQGVLKFE